MARKVMISCAVTGSADTPGRNPAVPVTPEQIANSCLDAAKAGLAEATKGWEDATAAFESGAWADALAKGQVVKAKTVEALEALGMPVPPAAKS